MAFYRKRLTYDEIAPAVQKFLTLLRSHASVCQEAGDGEQEVFFVDKRQWTPEINEEYGKFYVPLSANKMMHTTPLGNQQFFVYIDPTAQGPVPTVTTSHVRLPKLSYLITLTPEDFFAVMKLVATAKNTQSKDSLSLNAAAVGIQNIETHALSPFFRKLRTNYRFNDEYCDRKWTPRGAIAEIAHMEPTRDNQLSVMQYFTAMQNPDLIYFPVETMIALELEWEQMNNTDYCVPQNQPRGGAK